MEKVHPKLPKNIAMVIIINEKWKPYLKYAKSKFGSRKVRFITAGKINIWPRDNYIYCFFKDKPVIVLPGGDIMASEEHIFVGESTIKENIEKFKITREETISRMEAFFACPVEVLDIDSIFINNDIDSMLTFLPGKRVVLGNNDKFLQANHQKKLAGIKQRLLELRYKIIEIPWRAHERFGTETDITLISYNNVVFLDRHTILLPQYEIPEDNEAIIIWEQLGYKVIPIQTYCNGKHGGSIRCFINIIDADFVNHDFEDSSKMPFPPVSFQLLEKLIEMAI